MRYDELIAALRFCDGGECDGCCRYKKEHGAECYTLLRDAADAIEELSREYESIAKSLTESVELMRKRKAHADSYDLLYEEGGYNSNGV